jgi:hypothetical protein
MGAVTVTKTNDNLAGSLRQAIQDASAGVMSAQLSYPTFFIAFSKSPSFLGNRIGYNLQTGSVKEMTFPLVSAISNTFRHSGESQCVP